MMFRESLSYSPFVKGVRSCQNLLQSIDLKIRLSQIDKRVMRLLGARVVT